MRKSYYVNISTYETLTYTFTGTHIHEHTYTHTRINTYRRFQEYFTLKHKGKYNFQ